jgi:hypothetical protein
MSTIMRHKVKLGINQPVRHQLVDARDCDRTSSASTFGLSALVVKKVKHI